MGHPAGSFLTIIKNQIRFALKEKSSEQHYHAGKLFSSYVPYATISSV